MDRFKALVGKEDSEQGLVVCRVDEKKSLPGGNVALSWWLYPDWLKDIV
jgi:hypothetical protein